LQMAIVATDSWESHRIPFSSFRHLADTWRRKKVKIT
jgi:hypothetical protein